MIPIYITPHHSTRQHKQQSTPPLANTQIRKQFSPKKRQPDLLFQQKSQIKDLHLFSPCFLNMRTIPAP
jgi:hypothetical protein